MAVATDGHTAIIDEVVADKGYHSNQTLVDLATLDLRTYIAEPDRGRRNWTHPAAARDAVYANRRRIRGVRGLALSRRRSEYLERPNAHLYETGGMRRTHLRGHTNILKRLLVHIGGFNLGLLMRSLVGVGTPRSLQGHLATIVALVIALWTRVERRWRDHHTPSDESGVRFYAESSFRAATCWARQKATFNHGLLWPTRSRTYASATALPRSPQGSLPAWVGWPLTGRGSHPLDDTQGFMTYSSIPLDRPAWPHHAPTPPSARTTT